MSPKQYLNVTYKNTPNRINIVDLKDLIQVQKEIKELYELPVAPPYIQLWDKNIIEHQQIKTFTQLKSLSEEYFAEEGGLCLTIQLLSYPKAVKSTLSNQEIIDQVKRRRLSISNKLIATSGADFTYSDRSESFKVLAKSLEKRYEAWKKGERDKNRHPMPFLADGPGSGKSRFLQELSSSFINHVLQGPYSEEFKSVFKSPFCVNITFTNGRTYTLDEAREITIQKSICLRILFEVHSGYKEFGIFYQLFKHQELDLATILKQIGIDATCIILGIDQVSLVHEEEKNVNKSLLGSLFQLVGGLSCDLPPFFIPVVAGTVIGPMKSVIRESRYPPLHIPLPLLSFESCIQILEKKITKFSPRTDIRFRQLISDCGGHCRSLEILYDAILEINCDLDMFWNEVANYVRFWLGKRYATSDVPLGAAIAYSLLREIVDPDNPYPDFPSLKFQDLEERGIIKIENGIVRISYFFICSFLFKTKTLKFSSKWIELLIQDNFWWQDWALFNRNFITFRLSLYAYLGKSTVSIKEFFAGAKMNIPNDIHIKVPLFENLKISKADYRYPTTQAPEIDIGDHVLNGDGAPFDSFLYLETTTNDRLLLAFQMKLANQDSKPVKVIDDDVVNYEYNKINQAIAKCLPETDFVCVILARCEGTFDINKLPSKCIVISNDEHMDFYGPSFCHRLEKVIFRK